MAKRAVSFAQSTKVQGIAFDLRSHDIDDASTNDAESSIDDKSSQTVNTWVSTHCTFPMPADDNEETYEPTQVPLRTVFNLLDRDGSRTIDVREFCAILQALNPSGDLSIRKLIHCFPTAVLRPRDAEDERRLLAMITAPSESGTLEESTLDFDTFIEKWDSLPEDSVDETFGAPHGPGFATTRNRLTGLAMDNFIRKSSRQVEPTSRRNSSVVKETVRFAQVNPVTVPNQAEPIDSDTNETLNGATVHPRIQSDVGDDHSLDLAPDENPSDVHLAIGIPRAASTDVDINKQALSITPPSHGGTGSLMTASEKKCSFRRRHLRRAKSIHADWEIDANELKLGRSLGSGNFGLVREATWRGAPVAVKRLKASGSASRELDVSDQFDREVCLLANLRHPNILMFLGAVNKPLDGSVMIVTELLDLSLHEMLHDQDPPFVASRSDWYSICEQICRGLNYLHLTDPPIIHRDIKPKNVLIRRPLQVKIADFGVLSICSVLCLWDFTILGISIAHDTNEEHIIGLAGTLPYMSPELLRNEPYTEKADVYSFGMVAYEILTRSRPLLSNSPMRIILSVGIHGHRPKLPQKTPDEIKRLIRSTWAQDPASRPAMEQVLSYIREVSS